MNFIDLLELVVRENSADPERRRKPMGMDDPFAEESAGLDSLDRALLFTLMGEVYDVPREIVDSAPGIETPRKLEKFLELHAGRVPQTLDQAKEWLGL